MTADELVKVLDLTIKEDRENKLVTFLCLLSAFTEDAQFNISFNAPSSTGKSYIPTEIAKLFPREDVRELAYCSPTAFFHDTGKLDKERGGYEVDLARKIIIFLDQPHTQLLEKLRPLFSHDEKEIVLKITDKSQKGGLRTKNIFIKGFPSVTFCSAGLRLDEQESTRFLLLSPETSHEKIHAGIRGKILRDSDSGAYAAWLDANPARMELKARIRAIKEAAIGTIKISEPELVEEKFLTSRGALKPRHQRDIGRLLSIIKAFALLNLWFRERDGSTLVADDTDIEAGFALWDKLSECQEIGVPPFAYQIYREIILPAYLAKNGGRFLDPESVDARGLTRQQIGKKYFEVHGRHLQDWTLRQDVLPMLETAGLLRQEPDRSDKRRILYHPTAPLTASPMEKRNSEPGGGVNSTEPAQDIC